MPYDFLFTFVAFNQQTADLEKKDYSLEWLAYQDKRVDGPNISVSWTGTKLGPQTCFVTADWYKQKIELPLISQAIFNYLG